MLSRGRQEATEKAGVLRVLMEYRKAWRRVGPDFAGRARWLLRFAARDLARLSAADWGTLQAESSVFLSSEDIPKWESHDAEALRESIMSWRVPFSDPMSVGPRARARIARGQVLVRALLQELAEGRAERTRTLTLMQSATWKDGQLVVAERPPLSDLDGAWTFGFFRTLARVGARVRRCARQECARIFVTTKGQRYCSPACSNAVRQRRFRREHGEEVRAKRRQVYQRVKQAGLETLYKQLGPDLVARAEGITRDPASAAEIVSDTFLALIERRGKRGPGGIKNPEAWLRDGVRWRSYACVKQRRGRVSFDEAKHTPDERKTGGGTRKGSRPRDD